MVERILVELRTAIPEFDRYLSRGGEPLKQRLARRLRDYSYQELSAALDELLSETSLPRSPQQAFAMLCRIADRKRGEELSRRSNPQGADCPVCGGYGVVPLADPAVATAMLATYCTACSVGRALRYAASQEAAART